MSLYYPPRQDMRGADRNDWPDLIKPMNIGEAITAAIKAKESIYDSNTGWLILDYNGDVPSKNNMPLQPPSQLRRANNYGQTKLALTPPVIRITKGQVAPAPVPVPKDNWFERNWKWSVPIALGVTFLLMSKT